MVYGVPDISGIILVVLGLFWWIFVDNFWLENICRYLLAHFPVLGLSRNRGSAAQFFFLQKLYFIDFKLAFENEFPKPIFGRRPYRSVGPDEMQTHRSDRTLRHKPNFEEMDRV
ncbi:uncharacterized protein M6B38_359800 [Iris pallida]|uniref:Transmembrane protein n=1 Tax=Iris pallida TaxID=29817 RepID=A0AAX6GKN4_IRIPA|nr:uncharacterized protein M6B38_359800 [Iris pallida]